MWNDLVDAVKAKVVTSTEIDSDNVFDYRRSRFEGFPACVVVASNISNAEFADNQRNRRSYMVSIRIYQDRTAQNYSDAERIIRTISDDLIDIFDADPYLGNTLAGRGFIRPIPGRFLEPPSEGEGPDVIGMEILLEAVVIE